MLRTRAACGHTMEVWVLFSDGATLAWLLLAAFLVVGLILYERTGSRLGGVLVLPLLLLYALVDISVLLVFSIGSLASFVLGQFFYSQMLVYGRRLLYAFLLSGIGATMVAYAFVKPGSFGLVLAVLPGLFAYNLHREGRFLEGMSTFAIWFGLLLVAATAALWFLTDPEALSKLTGPAVSASGSTLAPGIVERASAALQPLAARASAIAASVSGAWDAFLAGGISLVAVASAADGGAE